MAISDFLTQTRTVRAGGRVYRVRSPTFATVSIALTLFAPEVAAAWTVHKTDEGLGDDASGTLTGLVRAGDPRLLTVLATCVTVALVPLDEVDAPLPNDDIAKALFRSALSLLDLPKVAESIDFKAYFSEDPEERAVVFGEGGPTPQEIGLVKIGQAFSVDPEVVASEWSYGKFLAVSKILTGAKPVREDEVVQAGVI